ncbi:MAG TPA: prepilin-type N-terminal cleavage/methylation domain-containing protein [Candidatus Paceibacterota bacterium]|nr:prepilin-type N-terminal cleavage/methylation domain-containing protein [Candidatus Paceibacterota bacterium]
MNFRAQQKGFTLIETVVSVAIFAFVAIGLYMSYAEVLKVVHRAQLRSATTALATEQFEIVRNLPYNLVGLKNGIPAGVLLPTQTLVRSTRTFNVSTMVRNIDLPFDAVAPSDTNPADNKLVELDIVCTSCTDYLPMSFTAQVGPKDLEASSTLGSLFVRTIDAAGNPVPGATVHVVLASSTAPIDYTDVTGANGMLQLVGVIPAINAYQVSATKAGYSLDQTYSPNGPTTTQPVLPHATIAPGTVTQLTFAIDLLAQLNVTSVTPACTRIPNVPFTLTSNKLIGTEPVYKYQKTNSTDGSGALTLPSMEWDSYTVEASKTGYDLAGVSPLSPFNLLPGASQNLQLVLVPQTGDPNDNTLLVTVIDGVTGLPLSGADVLIEKGGETTQNLTTGRGFLNQSDWSGGSGQEMFVDRTAYASDDGNVDVSGTAGSVKLKKSGGNYAASGSLESSIFSVDTATNFYQLRFSQTVQPAGTEAKFQLATANATSGPWVFIGPNGTTTSYYTATTTDISAVSSGKQFFKYKLYLTTTDSAKTPVVDDVSFTFSSDCVSSGQTYAQGLHNGTWSVTVSKDGYATEQQNVVMTTSKPWGTAAFQLDPN